MVLLPMKSLKSLVNLGLTSALSLATIGTSLFAQSATNAVTPKAATAMPVIRPGDNLKTDGLPEVPSELADSVRLYTEARGASMFSWHPKERGMLISTRFANSNQVHRVSMPGGARYQLTFFNEPVGSAAYPPSDDSYFLYTRDVGGNEFAQLYRFDLDSGKSTLLSDGGRSQNGGWVWDRSKSMVCYASTQRNGADRDIWGMNPKDPTSNRILFELKGGGWSAQDWSENNVYVLIRETLSINKSNLYLGEIAHGRLRPITPKDDEVSYGEAAFTADGRAIYVTSDRGSEFQQLSKMDLESGKLDSITSD
ncbi:MAG: hypothetical protein ACK5PZ_12360, partial [Pirellula sp.]